MATSNVGLGPRFAPHDPTLPIHWRALVDGSTGYIYYWNQETNVTQYERPVPQAPPLPAGPPPAATSPSVPIASTGSRNVSVMNGSAAASDVQITRPNDGQTDSLDGNVQANINGVSHGRISRTTNVINDGTPHRNTSATAYVNTGGPPHVAVHGSSGPKLHGNAPGNVHGTSVASAPAQPKLATAVCVDGNLHRSTTRGNVHGSMGVPPVHGSMHGSSGPKLQGSSGNMHGTGGNVHGTGENMHGTGGNMHGTGGNVHSSSAIPGQPKLAAIPVPRRQNISGVHVPLNSIVVHAHANSTTPGPSGVSVTSSAPAYKRNASTYNSYGDQDPFKKPRIQGYDEPSAATDVESYRRHHEVTAVGDNVPDPFMTFDATGFPVEILGELRMAGFTSPTPIQAQSWPIVLQNRDIVAIAKTGSGKTLGYLLPAFLHLRQHRNNSQLGPTVLVLSPTRELATQIQDEAAKFGRSSMITSTCVYGGAPKGPQLRDLERGADIVIATPGRLNDFLEMRKVSLRQVTYLVLDEADRMLDMGFEPQICKIVNEIPLKRQTLMYTATWPKEVRKIAGDLLVSPVQVNIGSADELTANKSITQYVEMVPPYEKHRRLEQILRTQGPDSRVIIFCSTKKMCDQLARTIGRDFGAAVIHGDKSQIERDHVIAQFKSGRSPILVATDVAARGLDIKDIRVVINFDFPTGIEDYVHRIGRTGRAGATGVAYTFFSEQDSKYAKELVKVLEGTGQMVPLELRDIADRPLYIKGRGGRWDAGGRGGQDGGRPMYRGGRGEGFGGRGAWGSGSQFVDRRDRSHDRFGNQERYGRDGRPDRYPDDRNRGREVFRSFGDRARSYSRSFSRSPSRSRDYSRSRSRSNDRYSDGYMRRSPYYGGVSRHSRSPLRSPSPYHGGSPDHSSPGDVARHGEALAPLQNRSPRRGTSFRSSSPQRGVSPRNKSPFRGYAPYQRGSPVYQSGSSYKGSSPVLNVPSNRWAMPFNSSSPRKGMASPIRSGSPRKYGSQYPGNDAPQKGILLNLNKLSPKVASPSETALCSKAALAPGGLPYVASHKAVSSFESTSPRKGTVPTPVCDSPCKDVSLYPSNVHQKVALPSFGKSSPPKVAFSQTEASVSVVSTANIGHLSHTSNVPSLKGALLYQSTLPDKGTSSPVRHVSPCKASLPYPSDVPSQKVFLPGLNKLFVKGVSLPHTAASVKDTSAHQVGLPSHTSNVSSHKVASPFQSPPRKGGTSPVRSGSPTKDVLLYPSSAQKGVLQSLNRSSSPMGVFPQVDSANSGLGHIGLPYHNSNVPFQKGKLAIQGNSPVRSGGSPIQHGSPGKDVLPYATDVPQKVALNKPSATGSSQAGLSGRGSLVHSIGIPFQVSNVPFNKVASLFQCSSPQKRGTSPVRISSPHKDVMLYPSEESPKVVSNLNDSSPKGTSATQIGASVNATSSHVSFPCVLNVSSQKEALPSQSTSPQKKGGASPIQTGSPHKDVSPYPIDVFQKGGMMNLNNSSTESLLETGTFVTADSSHVIGSS